MKYLAISLLTLFTTIFFVPSTIDATVKKNPAKKSAAAESKKNNLVDINTASFLELKTLNGVTDEYADSIIKNRPYKSKADLLQRKVIPQTVLNKIMNKITVKRK